MRRLLECVVNISEGRDTQIIGDLRTASGPGLLDVHTDPFHNRSVFTLAGAPDEVQTAARDLTAGAVQRLDLRAHQGVHPRIGVVDVVPFVHLAGWPIVDGPLHPAVEERDEFARWAATELELPCFVYGPERSLPAVRAGAWRTLVPDTGPPVPHITAGACAVGARPILVAYNLWLADPDLALAKRVAGEIREPRLRALGLQVGDQVQVSCNLIAPQELGPGAVFDAVASRTAVHHAELVGLLPALVLEHEPRSRWPELGLDSSSTIEARLEQAGLDGGRFESH